jgi:putative sensor protein/HAAS domain-containing protein
MFNTIEEYLDALKNEMKDADSALVQDAISDAREHLSNALDAAREKTPNITVADALKSIVEEYGSPEETASAYKQVERRTSPSLVRDMPMQQGSAIKRFLGVYDDPKAWGALLYMLISLITGVVYFTWAVTGLSLSLSFAIFIFGLLFAVFFIVSLRGLALLEGRIVESLLGVRMPRRPLFFQKNVTWFERLKMDLADKRTWLTLLYFFLQMPLGTIYFSVIVTLFALSASLMAAPIVQSITNFPILSIGNMRYFLPLWTMPIFLLAGFVIWTITMHLGRWIGQWHGQYAKTFLVTE